MATECMQDAFRASTRGNLKSQFKNWSQFCLDYSKNPVPCSGDDLVLYSMWLACSGRAHCGGTIRNNLSGVRTLHKLQGQKLPPAPSEYGPLELVVRGLSRRLDGPTRRMWPITPPILKELLQIPGAEMDVCTQEAETLLKDNPYVYYQVFGRIITAKVIRALYLVLFMSFLRLSSCIPTSVAKLDRRKQLVWSKVGVIPGGIVLSVTGAKNQKEGEVLEVPLAEAELPEFCPVAGLQELARIKDYPKGPDDAVFQIPDSKGGWKPLVRYQFVKVLDAAITAMGLDAKKYRPHAFRRGGMSFGTQVVKHMEMLRLHGGWSSNCYMVYVSLPPAARLQVTKTMSDELYLCSGQ